VATRDGHTELYQLPLAVTWGEEHLRPAATIFRATLAKARRGPRVGALHDATVTDDFIRRLIDLMHAGEAQGELRPWVGSRAAELEISPDAAVRALGAEQSNSSILVDERVIVKLYRRLEPGVHPEIEMGRFLTETAGYQNTPPLLGTIGQSAGDGGETALAAAFGFVANRGDGWRWTLNHLDRMLEGVRYKSGGLAEEAEIEGEGLGETDDTYMAMANLLGRRTAELHRALAIDTGEPAFTREPVARSDLEDWLAAASDQVDGGLDALRRARQSAEGGVAEEIDAVLALEPEVRKALKPWRSPPRGLAKTRTHGDYHLGQVIVAMGDFMILDFEGEPSKTVEQRRKKSSPMRDVAGMLRSFDYAAWASVYHFTETDPGAIDGVLGPALDWRDRAIECFLAGYRETIAGCPSWPSDDAIADRLIRIFLLEKIFYEVGYETANRPSWLKIPVRGILRLFAPSALEKSDDDRASG
jgi:maltose alpha-D-glucosyltransferase / alpha-amylase